MKRQMSHVGGNGTDKGSYTSSSRSGSDSASTTWSNTDSQSLAQHVEPLSTGQHMQSSLEVQQALISGKLSGHRQNDGNEQKVTVQPSCGPAPTLGSAESQSIQSAGFKEPLGHCRTPSEQDSVADRSNVIRRLSQSLLALSGNTLTQIEAEDSPGVSLSVATGQISDATASGRKVTGTPHSAPMKRYEHEEQGTSRYDAAASEQRISIDRSQAPTQVRTLPWPAPPLPVGCAMLMSAHRLFIHGAADMRPLSHLVDKRGQVL